MQTLTNLFKPIVHGQPITHLLMDNKSARLEVKHISGTGIKMARVFDPDPESKQKPMLFLGGGRKNSLFRVNLNLSQVRHPDLKAPLVPFFFSSIDSHEAQIPPHIALPPKITNGLESHLSHDPRAGAYFDIKLNSSSIGAKLLIEGHHIGQWLWLTQAKSLGYTDPLSLNLSKSVNLSESEEIYQFYDLPLSYRIFGMAQYGQGLTAVLLENRNSTHIPIPSSEYALYVGAMGSTLKEIPIEAFVRWNDASVEVGGKNGAFFFPSERSAMKASLNGYDAFESKIDPGDLLAKQLGLQLYYGAKIHLTEP